jgi:thiol:disulfide interchange protein DsbD
MRILHRAAALVLAATGWVTAAQAAPVRTQYVEAELVAGQQALVAGTTVELAVRLKHAPGWHTYWKNPGDSGLATRIEWQLPDGFAPGPIDWPTPKRIPVPPLANYGYEGEVLLPVQVTVPRGAFPGPVTLKARVDWLVCKTICLPDGADLTLPTQVVLGSPVPDPKWGPAIAAARAALPVELRGWQVVAVGQGDRIAVELRPAEGGAPASPPRNAYFFSALEGLVEPAADQRLAAEGGVLRLMLPVTSQLKPDVRRVEGVLVTDPQLAGNARAVNVDVAITGTLSAGPDRAHGAGGERPESMTGSAELGLAAAIALALLGGLILNLMPCVFPVLSIKILGFAEQAHGDRRLMHAHAAAFGVGVVLSFLALAAVLIALKAGGEAVGWGFQLQSPIVVAALAALFFLLALNLSGVFEILVPLPDAPVRPARHPIAASFGGGVLAAVVASPCTAPFMGAALGFAVTQGTSTALAVFGALGVGMALPYVILAWFPGWLARLPRPGPWLARLKQFLAFPLYGTVVWLAWVFGLQVGVDGIARLGAALVLLGLGAWLWGNAQRGARGVYRPGAIVAGVAAVAIAASTALAPAADSVAATPATTPSSDGAAWQTFSRAGAQDVVSGGKPVFVDFTAAWCVTCQVNKKLVLDRDATLRAFAAKSVVLMRADWTRRDPEITAALAALGRNGVPVYVLYRPGKAPLVLPEVLSAGVIESALASL